MMIHPDQRRAMGDAKIEMLEQAGYEWQHTLPGAFWHPTTGDSIDYHTGAQPERQRASGSSHSQAGCARFRPDRGGRRRR